MAATEQERADLARQRGEAAAKITDPDKKQKFIAQQGKEESKGEPSSLDMSRMSSEAQAVNATGGKKGLDSYKKGTDRVPTTGPAVLHKGEAVLNKHEADRYRHAKSIYGATAENMGGEENKPPKELKEIRTRKAKSGYIHEHHHTHPEHHPMEEHTSPNQDAMVEHMLTHMGEQNPGEADADAGQSGISAVAAPPTGE